MTYHAVITVLFFVAFLALVAWVYRPGRKRDYQELGEIPLRTDADGRRPRQKQGDRP